MQFKRWAKNNIN